MAKRDKYHMVGKRVRRKYDKTGAVGTVQTRGSFNGWWLIEWPDHSRKQSPMRDLDIVSEAEFVTWLETHPQ